LIFSNERFINNGVKTQKRKKRRSPALEHDSKEYLMEVALKVFAEKGYDGATVKEIAQKAKMNVSLISYYFEGKEGLLRHAMERFGRDRLQDAQSILTSPQSVDDIKAKLRLWLLQFINCHIDDPDVCAILHRENPLERPFMWDVFQKTFLKSFQSVADFFEQAHKKKLIREVDPFLIAGSFVGTIIHFARNQKIQQKWMGISIQDEKYRHSVVDQIVDLHFYGILPGTKGKK
jgi:AcrR family transcriptional regulator